MAYPLSSRKRVHAYALPRAPDGSAFTKCVFCGVSVAIALYNMHRHECRPKVEVKRFKGFCEKPNECRTKVEVKRFKVVCEKPNVLKQCPSANCDLIRESFEKNCNIENMIEIDRKGFEAWKNMSNEERRPYCIQADKVNAAHERDLIEEINYFAEVEDDEESIMVRKVKKLLLDLFIFLVLIVLNQHTFSEEEESEIFWRSVLVSLNTSDRNIRSTSLLISSQPSFGSIRRSLFPSTLQISKFKPPIIRNACGFDENGSFNGFPITPDKLFMQEAIGAEYGEGFETFRPDGPLKVDVDFLNDRLQEGFLKRIRYAMKPDEAYGLIFSWDNVVADIRTLKLNAWKQLASEEGKEIPEDGDVQRLMLNAGSDCVLDKVLRWGKEESELDRLKSRLSQLYYDNLIRVSQPMEGLQEWLDAMSTARIPCAVVSSLDRRNMNEALERMGLLKYFQNVTKFFPFPDPMTLLEFIIWQMVTPCEAIVSEEDGMESIAHRFLSAAVKLDRKPSKCVVFEDDPRAITAAHNCTMMAVALIGVHPAYELVQADLAVASFNELSVINLRRLFANKGSTFMDRQKQIIEKTPPKRKLTIDTIY
ncbi:hypothetical protein EZV62_025878 [Acer yangbiense]|uniref:HMG box domain-containing protein n=1 Tax=Acer yangbiense TaxID=1000413 RepID=A0A5C7GZE7_9ROSI|nr:hypothetical protein EZV62_025878 [Acer yangbiense]